MNINLPVLSKKARLAIQKGVEEEHHVCLMEDLGLTQRMLNNFDDHGIYTIGDLMSRTKEQMLELPNFGEKQIILLFKCLSKYHTLEN